MRKKKYNILHPVTTYATTGVGINLGYGLIGATSGTPNSSTATKNLLNSMGTGFNLMGTTGTIQTTSSLLGELNQLKKFGKKRR